MSRLVLQLATDTNAEKINGSKLPKQAKEILNWMVKEYPATADGPAKINQDDLVKTLDSHQDDNQILSTTPRQPISRIFNFYRKRLGEEGFIVITKTEAPPKAAKAEGGGEGTKSKASSRRRKDESASEDASAEL